MSRGEIGLKRGGTLRTSRTYVRTALALALGCLAMTAVLLPQGAAAAPGPMAAPTEAEMSAALVKAADWTMTVTRSDGQLVPPSGSPSWEVTSAGRMCLNGLVLLRAHQATADGKYLDRAKACAALAIKGIDAGKAYVIDRTGVLPSEAAGGFTNVQAGKIDDAYQAGYTGPVTYNLWECTRGMLFLIEMYHVTNNASYATYAVILDRFIHSSFAFDYNPEKGLFTTKTLSNAGTWTNSSIDSTVEHAVLLWTLRAGGMDLPFLWEDRIRLFNYLGTVAKGDGSFDDKTTYPGQTSSSETQHAIMIPTLWELGAASLARELATWVLDQQSANGSFECPHDMDDYGDTSWAALGLLPYGQVDAGSRAIAWLLGEQRTDGSWPYIDGHPTWASAMYSTEWASLAVYEGLRNFNLQINDTMLEADPIWEGEPARVVGFKINATVNNHGLTTARGVLVRAYDGDPALGVVEDETSVDVPALGSASVTLEFRPDDLGPHDVYVRVSFSAGREFRTSDNTAQIHININRDPTGVITSPWENDLFSFEAIINFKVDSVNDLDDDEVTFEWTDNVTGVLSNQPVFTRVLPPGAHNVRLHMMDGNGPGTWLEVNFSVRFNLAPTVRVTTPSDGSRYFDYQAIPFDASATSDPEGQTLLFTWMSDVTGLIGQGVSIAKRLPAGEHVITVWVDDGWANVSKTVTIHVTLTYPPVAVISVPEPDSEHVVTSRVRFESEGTSDPDSEFLEYYWTSSIDGLLSERPSFLAYLSVGRHTITLAVTDGNYNITTQVRIYVVENRPPSAIISSPANEAQFRSDEVVELNGSLSGDPEDAVTYFWVSDREGILGDMSVVTERLARGEHKITLWVDDGHGHNVSTSIVLTILNLPPMARIASPLEGDTLRTGEDVEFLSTGSSDPEKDKLTFAWEVRPKDGIFVPFSAETNARRTFDEEGTYEVRLTVNDGVANNTTVVQFRVVKKADGDDGPGFTSLAAAAAVVATASVLASRRRRRR